VTAAVDISRSGEVVHVVALAFLDPLRYSERRNDETQHRLKMMGRLSPPMTLSQEELFSKKSAGSDEEKSVALPRILHRPQHTLQEVLLKESLLAVRLAHGTDDINEVRRKLAAALPQNCQFTRLRYVDSVAGQLTAVDYEVSHFTRRRLEDGWKVGGVRCRYREEHEEFVRNRGKKKIWVKCRACYDREMQPRFLEVDDLRAA